MSTLLLRLAAPMQSWGSSTRFKKLSTEREPTKSGIIGLIAAALGRERNQSIDDLAALRFGVRIDQPGELLRDYHTAHHPSNEKLAFISERYYLCDAVFVVGLESDDGPFLQEMETALQNPRFPLYLGRRSCPPSGQIVLGISPLPLMEALKTQEWQAQTWYMRKRKARPEIDLEIVMDAPFESTYTYTKRDLPISFGEEFRRYRFRGLTNDVRGALVKNPFSPEVVESSQIDNLSQYETNHDPLSTLEVSDVSFKS